ncbi:hypothetical protein ADUPG1_011835 [Aduncisulcus paluster]|uniref:Uncharacterized protein n=1 Tax=Aduncisulcus paluster TaxID=2918883 RepID=A0ABQ5K1I5_9EUKA|nr:hypothetical protein ADUPG1_011835 [Aduncisulcus paluster]
MPNHLSSEEGYTLESSSVVPICNGSFSLVPNSSSNKLKPIYNHIYAHACLELSESEDCCQQAQLLTLPSGHEINVIIYPSHVSNPSYAAVSLQAHALPSFASVTLPRVLMECKLVHKENDSESVVIKEVYNFPKGHREGLFVPLGPRSNIFESSYGFLHDNKVLFDIHVMILDEGLTMHECKCLHSLEKLLSSPNYQLNETQIAETLKDLTPSSEMKDAYGSRTNLIAREILAVASHTIDGETNPVKCAFVSRQPKIIEMAAMLVSLISEDNASQQVASNMGRILKFHSPCSCVSAILGSIRIVFGCVAEFLSLSIATEMAQRHISERARRCALLDDIESPVNRYLRSRRLRAREVLASSTESEFIDDDDRDPHHDNAQDDDSLPKRIQSPVHDVSSNEEHEERMSSDDSDNWIDLGEDSDEKTGCDSIHIHDKDGDVDLIITAEITHGCADSCEEEEEEEGQAPGEDQTHINTSTCDSSMQTPPFLSHCVLNDASRTSRSIRPSNSDISCIMPPKKILTPDDSVRDFDAADLSKEELIQRCAILEMKVATMSPFVLLELRERESAASRAALLAEQKMIMCCIEKRHLEQERMELGDKLSFLSHENERLSKQTEELKETLGEKEKEVSQYSKTLDVLQTRIKNFDSQLSCLHQSSSTADKLSVSRLPIGYPTDGGYVSDIASKVVELLRHGEIAPCIPTTPGSSPHQKPVVLLKASRCPSDIPKK